MPVFFRPPKAPRLRRRRWLKPSAAVAITGAASLTLGALVATATGTVDVTGTSAGTLGTVTASATGTVDVQGAASVSLAALTSAATGAVDIVGTSSTTLGAVTSAATAAVDVVGSAAGTLAALTLTAEASSGTTGDLAVTLAALTSAATGTVDVAGSVSPILAALTASATGAVDVVGSTSATLAAVTIEAEGVGGNAPIAGTLSATLGTLAPTATGTVAVAGAASPTLGALTASATGAVAVVGTGAQTLAALSASATGTGATLGTLSGTLATLTGTGAGQVPVSGTAAPTLAALTSTSTGGVTVTGAAASTLETLGGTRTGAVAVVASLSQTLGALTGTAAGTGQFAEFSDAERTGLAAVSGVRTLTQVAVVPTTYEALVLASEPVGYWRMADGKDLSGNGYHGTFSGGAVSGSGGVTPDGNAATDFDGTGALSIPTTIPATAAVVSFEVWGRPDTLSTDIALPHRVLISGSNAGAYLAMSGNGLGRARASLFTDNGGGAPTQKSVAPAAQLFQVGQWTHLVWTYDGSWLSLYANGAFIAQTAATGVALLGNPATPWLIGRDRFGGVSGNWWRGAIDECAVYLRVLSADEIAAHYAARLRAFSSTAQRDLEVVSGVRDLEVTG